MDEYAGRILADRYRLPLPPSDEYELAETRAYDTYSGQEVLVRQVPLPEVVEAEVLDADGLPEGFVARDGGVRRASRADHAPAHRTGRSAGDRGRAGCRPDTRPSPARPGLRRVRRGRVAVDRQRVGGGEAAGRVARGEAAQSLSGSRDRLRRPRRTAGAARARVGAPEHHRAHGARLRRRPRDADRPGGRGRGGGAVRVRPCAGAGLRG